MLKIFPIKGLVLLGSLSLLLTGCASNHGASQIDDFGRYTQLSTDGTTKSEVYDLFGQPHDVAGLESGETVWTYYSISRSSNGLEFIPVVGLFAAGQNVDTRIANFYFSESGEYQKVESLKKAQYVNMWVGLTTYAAANDELERVQNEMNTLGLPFDRDFAQEMKGYADLVGK